MPEFAAGVIPGWDGVLDAIGERIGKHPDQECGCPTWVVRCAHWGGLVLAMSEIAGFGEPLPHDSRPFIGLYSVRLGEQFETCTCHGRLGRRILNGDRGKDFPDLSAAEAEFHRREQELLNA